MAAMQAVDATGTPTGPRWKTMGNLFTTPAIGADGTVYVGNGVDGLLAFSPDGGIEWTHSTGPVYASPAVGPDGTVYIGVSPTIPVDGGVYGRVEAINPGDGGTIWSCELPTAKEVHSSPAIGADGTLYIGCDEGVLYAVVQETTCDGGPCATVKWSYNAGGVLSSSPAIGADGTIYVGSKAPSSGLHAIEPKKGKRLWRLPEVGSLHSSPAIGPDGTVYVGSNDNRLYAVDPSSSCDAGPCIKWSVNSNGAVRSSPAVGADGVIYLLMAASPNVYSMQALSPNGGGLVWEQATNDSYGYSSPAIGADGTVWVGTQTAPDSGTVSGGSLFSFRP